MLVDAIAALCALSVLLQAPGPASAPAAPLQMTTYQLVMLKKGPAAASADTPDGRKVIEAHVDHVYRLANEGLTMAAGPFLDGGDIQGIHILRAASPDAARQVLAGDPAVKAGIFAVDVAPFMSPAGWFGKWAAFGSFEQLYFGFLNTGPDRSQDAETAKRLQAEHLAYMDAQAKTGHLVLAGPFTEAGARRGVVVYRVADEAEARRRAEGDPMVKAGRLAVELHPWQVPQGALPTLPK